MAECMFLDRDFLRRDTPVDFSKLPERCCAKCRNWIECDGKVMSDSDNEWINPRKKFVSGFGACPENSNLEWDAFTWADDICENFEPDFEFDFELDTDEPEGNEE